MYTNDFHRLNRISFVEYNDILYKENNLKERKRTKQAKKTEMCLSHQFVGYDSFVRRHRTRNESIRIDHSNNRIEK